MTSTPPVYETASSSSSCGRSTPPTSICSSSEIALGGSWCPRYSHTGKGGVITVVTPWYPYGVEKGMLQLGREVEDFAWFMEPTRGERGEVLGVRRLMQEIVTFVWGDATVKVVGGHGLGTALPGAVVEMVVEGCPGGVEGFEKFREVVVSRGYVIESEECGRFLLSGNGSPVQLMLGFEDLSQSGTVRKELHTLKKILTTLPTAPKIAKIIETVLNQMKYTDTTMGGLSPYALLVLSIAACRISPNPTDPGECLHHFFSLYSDFDFSQYTVTPFEEAFIPRLEADHHHDAQLSVLGTDLCEANLGYDCCRMPQIKAHFQYSAMALKKWDGNFSGPVMSGGRKGYKGRTPLSLIVPLQPLWGRAESMLGGEVARKFQ